MAVRLLNSSSKMALHALRLVADIGGTLGSPKERALALRLDKIEGQLQLPFETFAYVTKTELRGAASVSSMPDDPIDPDSPDWYALSGVMVHPRFRGRGIGRLLVQRCIARAIERRAVGILLELNTPNPSAEALYESLGFEVWNVLEAAYQYEGRIYDKVSMRLRLRRGA